MELDKEPYETAVAVKKAAVDMATANLAVAEASVRSIEAKARSQRGRYNMRWKTYKTGLRYFMPKSPR